MMGYHLVNGRLSTDIMYYVLVLALLAGACAVPAEVPDYLGAYNNANRYASLLQLRLNGWPTPEKPGYLVLKNTISGLADVQLLLHLKYDQVYELGSLLSQAFARGLPDVVKKLQNQREELAKFKTAEIRKLIKQKCLLTRRSSVQSNVKCNEEVQDLVKDNPQLQREANLLLAVGELGYLYLKLDPELLAAAENKQESAYLLTGKAKLQAIVAQTLETYNLLYF